MPLTDRRTRRPGQGLTAAQVKAALLPHAEDLFRAAFGRPANARAHSWRARHNDAISMKMRGPKRGLWIDFSADAGGDLLDLVAVTRCGLTAARSDFPKVLEEAARMCGLATGPQAWRGFPKPGPDPGPIEDDPERNAWNVALVEAVIARVLPVAGTPAAAYLAGRGITDLPETGLGWLGPVPGLPVRSPRSSALLVWGLIGTGWPAGGQRILVTPRGKQSRAEVRKPAFGRIAGFPARFPRAAANVDGPLVVAEGPESALSIRQATGLECWAVFGASGWKRAPLPGDRTVILAPDRDAPGSQAGHAFRRAVFRHRARGVDLLIAEAPEPEGSKRDLNDTARRAGDDAVRAAVEAARPVNDGDMEDPGA